MRKLAAILVVLAASTVAWIHYADVSFTDADVDELDDVRNWIATRIQHAREGATTPPSVSGWLSTDGAVASDFERDMADKAHRFVTSAGQVWVERPASDEFSLVIIGRGRTTISTYRFKRDGVGCGGNLLDRTMRVEGWIAGGIAGFCVLSLLWLAALAAVRWLHRPPPFASPTPAQREGQLQTASAHRSSTT